MEGSTPVSVATNRARGSFRHEPAGKLGSGQNHTVAVPSPGEQLNGRAGIPNNTYARWRVDSGVVSILRDDQDWPPEDLLQSIWQNQRLLRDKLRTFHGEPVRVFHPGFRSLEGGPDFRGAIVQIGEDAPLAGDIEIDLRRSGWRSHGHAGNPNFGNVILHVVWESPGEIAVRSQTDGPSALSLRGTLDAPLGHLSFWYGGDKARRDLPENLRGACSASLRAAGAERLQEILHEAAEVRLRGKAAQFEARARQAGWEQALWEGLFRALGYKQNVWPMQYLAELRPLWFEPGSDLLKIQARLFGISGLLPPDLTRADKGADAYIRGIWDQWWRDQDGFAQCILPRQIWRFNGLRPANHPQRRVALAAQLARKQDLPRKAESWCAADAPKGGSETALMQTLAVEQDPFWSWHWNFRCAKLIKAQPLIGSSRMTDLAVNVILPWLLARALEGKNEKLVERIKERFFAWPAAQDNSVLRLARQRLLGQTEAEKRPPLPKGAAAQQGLIQIVRDFCDNSNALCEGCKFPGLVGKGEG